MALEFASRKATFPNYRKFETTFAGRPFVVETGKLCGLANGSAMIRYGETCVLCNVTMSEKPREGVDFFPLSVEFEEKLYAAGRIPGSFMRREGRPGEHAILSSRVVDRPIRPLFPKDMRNDVCVTMTVMSLDPDCSPEIAGMNGASLAIAMSDIPWNGPIGGVAVGYVDGEIVLNPTKGQMGRAWVWPRVNRPEPCTRGSTPTSAASGRISLMPRPSTRLPSSSSQVRTTFFCSL